MIRTTIRAAAFGVAAIVALAATDLSAQQDFSWSGSVDRGDAVTIRGINGDVTARAASGNQVRVTAVKTSEDDPVSSVSVEVIEDAEGVLICAVYPTPRRADEDNRCARGRAYKMDTSNNDVHVDFIIEIPEGVELEGITVNGDVDINGLSSTVEAVTVNGDVRVDTRGAASATTVNGSMDVRVGRLDGDQSFTTVNGSITLTLPDGAAADLDATTVNGSIETDFPITIRGRWGPRTASGEIGGGGADLEITTVNGSIVIRRG